MQENTVFSQTLIAEIEQLIQLRLSLKYQARFDEADEIKRRLWEEPYSIRLLDSIKKNRTDTTSGLGGDGGGDNGNIQTAWEPRIKEKEPQFQIEWDQLPPPLIINANHLDDIEAPVIPFIINTVNNQHYHNRYHETLEHLEAWQGGGGNHRVMMQCQPCYLLDIREHPNVAVKKILFEGWRTKLIPWLLNQLREEKIPSNGKNAPPFVLIGEDDIRMPQHLTPSALINTCQSAFVSYPEIDFLSLGHSWKSLSWKNRHSENSTSLWQFLQRNSAGLHASTLLAIRWPNGVHLLRKALDDTFQRKKQTHLDQFLFYSVHHELNLALSDPPLVGWTEVEVTLTTSGSGHRRRGGGRLGFLPPPPPTTTPPPVPTCMTTAVPGENMLSTTVSWVRRRRVRQSCLQEECDQEERATSSS